VYTYYKQTCTDEIYVFYVQTTKFGKENGTPQASIPSEMSSLSASRSKEGTRDSYVLVEGGGESGRNSRPRNEIVFKPNVQPDVFTQVAKQSGQTTEQVMRNHEAGKSSAGVAAVGVGSGEKFSFARLRQAISKKVSGAINKVDICVCMFVCVYVCGLLKWSRGPSMRLIYIYVYLIVC
jgi:hypothetical protein